MFIHPITALLAAAAAASTTTTSFVLAQQSSVPSDLSTAFNPGSITLQVLYSDASKTNLHGILDGASISQQETSQTPSFSLGDSSEVNPNLVTMILLVDTTSTTNRQLHFLQTGFSANLDATSIDTNDKPLVAYAPPGTLAADNAEGTRKYSWLLFLQPGTFKPASTLQAGDFDVKRFITENGLEDAIAGLEMVVDISNSGTSSGTSSSSSSSVSTSTTPPSPSSSTSSTSAALSSSSSSSSSSQLSPSTAAATTTTTITTSQPVQSIQSSSVPFISIAAAPASASSSASAVESSTDSISSPSPSLPSSSSLLSSSVSSSSANAAATSGASAATSGAEAASSSSSALAPATLTTIVGASGSTTTAPAVGPKISSGAGSVVGRTEVGVVLAVLGVVVLV